MTVADLKNRLTFSEFLDWVHFLGQEETWRAKQELYLAQIAAEIRKTAVKSPRKVRVKDFLVKTNDELETEDAQRAKMERSKSVWASSIGITLPKKKRYADHDDDSRRSD